MAGHRKGDLISYRRCLVYRYKLEEPYKCLTGIKGQAGSVGGAWVAIDPGGLLEIKKGYHWDGPSGPTIDTKNFIRGSLVHDALYQLIREGVVDKKFREHSDKILRAICRDDGMGWLRARWVYRAVRLFGKGAAKKKDPYPLESAPWAP